MLQRIIDWIDENQGLTVGILAFFFGALPLSIWLWLGLIRWATEKC